jgi:hypothetical protein
MTWTPEILSRALELRARGVTYQSIADRFGCTVAEAVGKIRRYQMAKRVTSPRQNMPERIRQLVARRSWELGYDPKDILSSAVYREVSHARHEVMRTVRREIIMPNGRPPSYPLIGLWFGRDHSTVMQGIEKAEERMRDRVT